MAPTPHCDISISLQVGCGKVVMSQKIDHRRNKTTRQCTVSAPL